MAGAHLFELVIAMFLAIIALHYLAHRLGLPPSVALLAGGAILAFVPGLPAITVDPELVLVIFLPPLLLDGAWSIAAARLRRHLVGIASLAIGAVFFTTVVVAIVAHFLVPSLPWAACAALGAIVSPPDAVSARAVLERVRLPRRLQILLEGESLLNDASGLVLFRLAVAALATGAFSVADAASSFLLLAFGGALVGVIVGTAWVKFVRHLGDEYLIIAATTLLAWISYLLGEFLHVSGVIATVTTGLVASWHQHTVLSAATRMRGTSFWTVVVFLMEAAVFILIGLSLRAVVERGGGFGQLVETMAFPAIAILITLLVARFAWVFGSELVIKLCNTLGLARTQPLGIGGTAILGWAGVRGVVTLALALSLPEDFPGRDFILVMAFAVIVGTVLLQGTTLGPVITWAGLVEAESERARMTMSQAEAAMAQVQFATVRDLAYDGEGKLVHPQLLDRYQRRATTIVDYAKRTEDYMPMLHAHFDVVLEAVAAGRKELIRLHRAGEIDDETLHELERDLDLEELSAISAKA
ncbi:MULTISPECIES: Na+/H+ antiporter [Rhizobium]|uniref:CPA1 family monovalent cation:H+ antiporter n=2 Tax=Rhizobium mongolense TaxID=57676 RepID=A0ABR6ILX6_9HYPH|nr:MULTISPECIES: Na+/H+ antiporter [Rhizobium]MBB4228876.1 CPA1 family monovalent cation:H+ antiporter [Rhizobium mongolense]TVZ63552.1 CPA1 family monovalent cation:H+ antiporter [Rhizobium mongolense USDA 1844]ULJ72991.1 Na+/H+ antiporter [Rhizobium gallicum]